MNKGLQKLLACLLWCAVFIPNHLYAQTHLPVKGTLRSVDNSTLLPGVTILADGKLVGITDENGAFSIKVEKKGTVLLFSMIGYEKLSYTVNDIMPELKLRMKASSSNLNEVVVTTALGIKRQEKALGYAQQTINAEALTDARPNNWSDALRGKVAGLNIASLGGPLNSQEIRLRGESSLTTNGNAALVVVDGIPVNGGLTTSGASNMYMGGDASIDVPVDFGNGIADINPDDIESISVLKGPGATALYGSRAANGAVLITTKSGKTKKGLGISLNSNTSYDVITRWPDYQYEYGQGDGKTNYNTAGEMYYSYGVTADGRSTGGSSSAFGPKFNGQSYFQYDPKKLGTGAERTPWVPYKDNRKSYWQTGRTTTNSITLDNTSDAGSIRASLTHTDNKWIMPSMGFKRTTASVNAGYKISSKIKVSSVVNYTNKSSDNLPGLGYNNHSIAYFMIFQNPNVDLNWYRPLWRPGFEGIDMIRPYSSFIDNPFAMTEAITNGLRSNQITGNLKVDAQLTPKLSLMVRTGINGNQQARDQRRPWDINRYGQGFYQTQQVYSQEINSDFLLSYRDAFDKGKFTFGASVGANSMSSQYDRTDNTLIGLVVPGVYKMTNGVSNPLVATYDADKKVNSVYGLINLAYREKIFLDLTGRNDWSSTLPQENWSFFYPSANLSVILSDMIRMPKAISFAKYRLSFAQVGNDTDPYRTNKYYNRSDFPSSAEAPTQLYNLHFKPEIATSIETGVDLGFLKNRLRIDASVYQTNTKNQILSVPLEHSTGFSSAILNSGEIRNRGLELIVTATPIKNKTFTWNTTLTWAATRSKVMSLDPRLGGKLSIMGSSSATLTAVEGQIASALYGLKFERSPDGQIIYSNGLPVVTQVPDYIGDTNPDWRAGLINNFTYKGFRLSATVDGQYGGILYSHSHHKMTEQGKLKHTLKGREEGWIVGEGVMQHTDGTYVPNTVKVRPADYYAQYYRLNNTEANSFDASFLKFREVSLEYSLPSKWIARTFLQNVSVAAYGRNLAVWSDFPIYDPEVATQAGGTGILTGVEVGQMPVPATYGFNLKVKL